MQIWIFGERHYWGALKSFFRERHYCLRCLNGFAYAKSLGKHKEYCEKHPVARRVLPEPEKATLQFKELELFDEIVYADFEALTKPAHLST